MVKLNLQKIRKEFSSLPTLKHHPCVIYHGRQLTNPEDYIRMQSRSKYREGIEG